MFCMYTVIVAACVTGAERGGNEGINKCERSCPATIVLKSSQLRSGSSEFLHLNHFLNQVSFSLKMTRPLNLSIAIIGANG